MDRDAILKELGRRFPDGTSFAEGRTGLLLRATDTEQNRSGLLKVLEASLSQGAEGMRLKRELGRQLRMSHPHVALPTAMGDAGGRLWLFRDFIDGESLRARLERETTLPMTESLAIVAQIASGLDELHRAGMLHRDLKPEHVILSGRPDEVPSVVLIDASIAAPIEGTAVADLRGTAEYVSPEQAKGKLVSFRSDLYSLGCILYELLTGAPPFTGVDAKAVLEAQWKEPPPDPPAGLPDGGRLLSSLLAKEPRQRPFSAQQVRRQLEPFLPEALRQLVAAGPPSGVPSRVSSPGLAAKRTLVGVPPVAKATGSGGAVHGETDEGWHSESTVQIDPSDLIDVQDAPRVERPRTSIPPPIPEAARSRPPPGRTSVAPPPNVASERPLASADGPDPSSGRPDAPWKPPRSSAPPPDYSLRPEDADVDGPPASRGRVGGPRVARSRLLLVVIGAFVFGAVLSGIVVYLVTGGLGAEPHPRRTQEVAPSQSPPHTLPTIARAATETPAPSTGSAKLAARFGTTEPTQRAGADASSAAADDDAGASATVAPEEGRFADAAVSTDMQGGAAQGEERAAPGEAAPIEHRSGEAERAPSHGTVHPAPRSARPSPPRRPPAEPAVRPAEPAVRPAEPAVRPSPPAPLAPAATFDEALAQARDAFRRRDYAAAAQAYEQATRFKPKEAGSFAGLGAARLALGDTKGAVAAYEQAVRLEPQHAGFQAALGRAYQAGGDTANARTAYQRALELDPNNRVAQAALQSL